MATTGRGIDAAGRSGPNRRATNTAAAASPATERIQRPASMTPLGTPANRLKNWATGGGYEEKRAVEPGGAPPTIAASYGDCPAATSRPAWRTSSRSNPAVRGDAVNIVQPRHPRHSQQRL